MKRVPGSVPVGLVEAITTDSCGRYYEHSLSIFMFAMECASKLHKCGCSSFDVETINNEFRI